MNLSDDRRSTLKRWLPVVLWSGLIFYFSTESFAFDNTAGFISDWLGWFFPGIAPAQLTWPHLLLRKFGHWFEYFILALLLLRALRRDDGAGIATGTLARTLLIVLVYAASDEYHQSWVPQRTASAVDVMIDTFGGICGVSWSYLRRRRRMKA